LNRLEERTAGAVKAFAASPKGVPFDDTTV
jgi:hypothetical protein